MKIDKFKHTDNWQDVKDATMNTIGKIQEHILIVNGKDN